MTTATFSADCASAAAAYARETTRPAQAARRRWTSVRREDVKRLGSVQIGSLRSVRTRPNAEVFSVLGKFVVPGSKSNAMTAIHLIDSLESGHPWKVPNVASCSENPDEARWFAISDSRGPLEHG